MISVMFVCHGNICRSPMAEFVMKDMLKNENLSGKVFVASSATSTEEIGNPVHRGTRKKLAEYGISTDGKYAVQFTKADYDKYDYIIAMDNWNLRNLARIIGDDRDGKVSLLLDFAYGGEVADPWYTGNFDETYKDVTAGCRGLLHELKQKGLIPV